MSVTCVPFVFACVPPDGDAGDGVAENPESLRSGRAALAYRAMLDRLEVVAPLDDPLHEDARRVDLVGTERARLDQLLDLRDRDASGGGHHRIEVACGLAIDEVALGIALPCLDERDVGR